MTKHSCTSGNTLIRVQLVIEVLTVEEFLDFVAHVRNTSRTSDHDHLTDVFLLKSGLLESLPDWFEHFIEDRLADRLEITPGQFGSPAIFAKRINVKFLHVATREELLSCLTLLFHFDSRFSVLTFVFSCLLLVPFEHAINHGIVEILATESRTSSARLDFILLAAANLENGHIESATTKVVDQDISSVLARNLHTLFQGCSDGLLEKVDTFKSRQGDRGLGGIHLL